MALNTPYKRINPNSINYAAVGQRDPWFALGYALGEGYWNNYNARGTKKSIEGGKNQLDEYFGSKAPSSQPAPQDIIDQAMTISVGGNTVGEKDADKASNGNAKGTIKPELDHAMLKWGYTLDKYKDNPNPIGDSIKARDLAQNTATSLEGINMDGANWDEFEAAFRRQMTLDNRNMQQQDAAVAAIKPLFDARMGRYNAQKADELSKAAIAAFDNGDYKLGESYALQLSKYDKDIARYLLNKENARYQNELAIGRQNSRVGARGSSSGLFGSAEFKYAVDEMHKLEDEAKERQLDPVELGRLNSLRNYVYANEQAYFVNQGATQSTTNNGTSNDVQRAKDMVTSELKKGRDPSVVRRDARAALKAGKITQEQYNAIHDALIPLKARKHKEETPTFDGRDATKRSGLAKGLSEKSLARLVFPLDEK